jgi:hypothetical protein
MLFVCICVLARTRPSNIQYLNSAQNVTQDTRMDHVLITLGQLYLDYCHPDIDDAVHEKICLSLKTRTTRWRKADQDAFIMAVVLNPYLRNQCLNYEVAYLTAMGLSNIARQLYLRMFHVEAAPLEFFSAFHDYLDDRCEFSAERMQLKEFKAHHKAKVWQVMRREIWN